MSTRLGLVWQDFSPSVGERTVSHRPRCLRIRDSGGMLPSRAGESSLGSDSAFRRAALGRVWRSGGAAKPRNGSKTMGAQVNPRRRAITGLVSMVLGAGSLIWAFPGNAGATTDQESTPATVAVDGNATCAELAPEGVSWIELKVDPVEDGTFSDDTLTVTIDVTETDDGPVFDWTSNIGVDAVFVKGGPGGLLYVYDPPEESTGDTGLHAPINPANDNFYGLSHVSFCYDEDVAPTTTTTETPTTPTPEAPTTATTVAPTTTTTEAPTTTTTEAPTTTTTEA